jgi:DNA-directed RNA polymerase subunit RPC12/RpoP
MEKSPQATSLPHRCVRCRAPGAEWTVYDCTACGALTTPHAHGTWLCTGCKQGVLLPALGRPEVDRV